MTKQTQEEIERRLEEGVKELVRLSDDGPGRQIYKTLVSKAQNLATKVKRHRSTEGFDNFYNRHNLLSFLYITGFDQFTSVERENGALLLSQVKSYINGVLDVYRVREMRDHLTKSLSEQRGK